MDIKVGYSTMIIENMEESVTFYRDVLGFKVHSTYLLGADAKITLLKGNGGAFVELIENKQYPIGLYSVGMEVDDMDIAMKKLREKGAKIISEPIPTTVGTLAFVEAPSGIKIAIIHHDSRFQH